MMSLTASTRLFLRLIRLRNKLFSFFFSLLLLFTLVQGAIKIVITELSAKIKLFIGFSVR